MSKSLGNFFTVADILEHFEPKTLRFFILSTHYRSPLDFSDERLKEAQRSLARLKNRTGQFKRTGSAYQRRPSGNQQSYLRKTGRTSQRFYGSLMSDHFNAALAISFMFELAKENCHLSSNISTGSEKPDGKLVDNMEKPLLGSAALSVCLETSAQPAAENLFRLKTELIEAEEVVKPASGSADADKNYAQADALRNAFNWPRHWRGRTPQGVRLGKNSEV